MILGAFFVGGDFLGVGSCVVGEVPFWRFSADEWCCCIYVIGGVLWVCEGAPCVGGARLVEQRVVIAKVTGSTPVTHLGNVAQW